MAVPVYEHLKYDEGKLAECLALEGVARDDIPSFNFQIDVPAAMKPAFNTPEQADTFVENLLSPVTAGLAQVCAQYGLAVDEARLLSFVRTIFERFPPARRQAMARRLFDVTNGRSLAFETGNLGHLSVTDVDAGRLSLDAGLMRAVKEGVSVEILLATLIGRNFFGQACGLEDEEQLNMEDAENTLALFDRLEAGGSDPTPFFQSIFKTLEAVRVRDAGMSFSYIDCLQANVKKKEYAIPDLIGGRYKPLAVLGEGGMGIVFLARNQETGSKVAVKITKGTEEELVRFIREVRLIKDVNHPYVIGIESFNTYGESGNRHAYYAMRYCPWPTLKELLDEGIGRANEETGRPTLTRRDPGKFSMLEYMEMMANVLMGLEAIHRQQLVHRDIKPENIKYDPETETPIIMDFGLVKSLKPTDAALTTRSVTTGSGVSSGEDSSWGQTRVGSTMGTPGYMSPEQTEDAARVDQRTDLFAVGVMLYEMLTGDRPFEGRNQYETLSLVLTQTPRAPSKLNPAIDRKLEAMILKGLEKDPANRYQTAGDLRAALEEYVKQAEAAQAGVGAGTRPKKILRVPKKGVSPAGPGLVSRHGPAEADVAAPSAHAARTLPAQPAPMEAVQAELAEEEASEAAPIVPAAERRSGRSLSRRSLSAKAEADGEGGKEAGADEQSPRGEGTGHLEPAVHHAAGVVAAGRPTPKREKSKLLAIVAAVGVVALFVLGIALWPRGEETASVRTPTTRATTTPIATRPTAAGPAALAEIQELFKGKVKSFDERTLEIVLSYDFERAEELDDWDGGPDTAIIKDGKILSSAGDRGFQRTLNAAFVGDLTMETVCVTRLGHAGAWWICWGEKDSHGRRKTAGTDFGSIFGPLPGYEAGATKKLNYAFGSTTKFYRHELRFEGAMMHYSVDGKLVESFSPKGLPADRGEQHPGYSVGGYGFAGIDSFGIRGKLSRAWLDQKIRESKTQAGLSPATAGAGGAVPAEIQKLFKGKVEEFNSDTGGITLFYDFKDPDQLQDWRSGYSNYTDYELRVEPRASADDAQVVDGALRPQPKGAGVGHKAEFCGDVEFSFMGPMEFGGYGQGPAVLYRKVAADRAFYTIRFRLMRNKEKELYAFVGHGMTYSVTSEKKPVAMSPGQEVKHELRLKGTTLSYFVNDKPCVENWTPPPAGREGNVVLQTQREWIQLVLFPAYADNVRIKGMLRKEWLAEELKKVGAAKPAVGAPAVSSAPTAPAVPAAPAVSAAPANIQKLFKGKVEQYDPATGRITLAYDFQSPEQKEDWAVPTKLFLFLDQSNPHGHAAVFAGDLEFSLTETLTEATFGGWPLGKGGVAWQSAGAREWNATAAGFDHSIDQNKTFVHLAVGLHGDPGREVRKEAPFQKKMGGVCFEVFRAANEQPLTYSVDGKEILWDTAVSQAAALRPVLPAGEIKSARLVGTLQKEWLEEKLKTQGGGKSEAPLPSKKTDVATSAGLAEVQKLFHGKVEGFDPATGRITLAYDFAPEIKARGSFRNTEQAKDWDVTTTLSYGPQAPLGHKALFSGDLEFSCKVFIAGWWFQETAHGGVAWQRTDSKWEAVRTGLIGGEKEKTVSAQIYRWGHDRQSKPVANKRGEYPCTCVVKMTDARETVFAIDGTELVRDVQPFQNVALRPFLPAGVDAVISARLVGTLQKEWLAEKLKELKPDALAPTPGALGGPVVRWTNGGGDGKWANAANWDLKRVPQAGDNVLFDQTSASDCLAMRGSVPQNLKSFTTAAYAGTITLAAEFAQGDAQELTVAGDLNLLGGALVVTGLVRGEGEKATGVGVAFNAAGFTVGREAVLHSDERGFPVQSGPGCGNTTASGGAHGGDSSVHGKMLNRSYGSPNEPVTLGSGGGGDPVNGPAKGGGAIKINVKDGRITLDGAIRCNGGSNANNFGGGAGGGIFLICGIFGGGPSGQLQANGGNSGKFGGGGGRIAVYYRTKTFAGTISAAGGMGGGKSGENGTVVVKSR